MGGCGEDVCTFDWVPGLQENRIRGRSRRSEITRTFRGRVGLCSVFWVKEKGSVVSSLFITFSTAAETDWRWEIAILAGSVLVDSASILVAIEAGIFGGQVGVGWGGG